MAIGGARAVNRRLYKTALIKFESLTVCGRARLLAESIVGGKIGKPGQCQGVLRVDGWIN
ncbi:hypothetical protein DZK27_15620 [Rhodobacteraceae bacterium 63075]|nr:hypothetical protein DZK27_15620 [Rhodobacteraceae bacterium 63075]